MFAYIMKSIIVDKYNKYIIGYSIVTIVIVNIRSR